MSTNAFEALLTPETLRARREAELAQVNKDQPDFWVRQANMAGSTLRQALRKHGIGLTERDKTAAYNQGILQQAAQSAAGMVKDGMDPDEARAQVLENAAREFLSNGNYQEADAMLKQASTIRGAQLERRKLQTDIEYTAGAKTANTNAMALSRLQAAEAALSKASTAEERSFYQNKLDEAKAEYYGRMPQERGAGASGASGLTKKTVGDLRNQMAGWLGYTDRVKKTIDILARAPRTGTKTAGAVAPILQEIQGLLGITPVTSSQIIQGQDEVGRMAYSKARPKIAVEADRLGVNYSQLEALVIDMAYSRARIRDPGGRLSDKDFKVSLDALGASGDANAMASVLREDLGLTWNDVRRLWTGNKLDTPDEPLWGEGSERAEQLGLYQPQAAPTKAVPTQSPPAQGGPAKGETARQRLERIKRENSR